MAIYSSIERFFCENLKREKRRKKKPEEYFHIRGGKGKGRNVTSISSLSFRISFYSSQARV